MNADSASSAGSGPAANQRKERGAIAAQACDTCRSRKQKCDEQRPKCGLCQRMKIECRYREPLPTKKDKTLVEILDRLKRLEGKIDCLPGVSTPASSSQPQLLGFGPPQSSSSSQLSFAPDHTNSVSYSTAFSSRSQPSPGQNALSQPYRHVSAAHKMLIWPAIEQVLIQAMPSNIVDIRSLEQEGSAFIVRLQRGTPNLPLDEHVSDTPFVGMQSQANRTAGGGPRVTFPGLDLASMDRLANAYFDTFNFLYPFMDRQLFLSETLNRVYTEGFNGDTDSVIALLVFALGELAIAGAGGKSIETSDKRLSGLRGGTLERPPGLALFNEARKRLGFVMTECDLENVQIFSLAALYYQSCSRHVDFWRLTVNASNACTVLITTNIIDWSSQKGDMIKRAYWHCMIMETGLHLELDLPLTSIYRLEDRVGLPSFEGNYCEQDYRGNQSSHFEKHYASQLALRRLCATLHNDINASMSSNIDIPSELNEGFAGPSINTLKRLAASLTRWLDILPTELRWPEDDPTTMPPPTSVGPYGQTVDPALSSNRRSIDNSKMFTTDLQLEPMNHAYAYDIQTALLRTRYYYAKYMVHRPFVYKALHFPDQMTRDDYSGAADCLKACLRWPICMSPTAHHKRLVPYLFCWSQNFLGILLILHLSRYVPCLVHIRQNLCGPNFEEEVSESVSLMLEWIQDLKSSDPIASWCWNILKGVYQLGD